MKRNGFDREMCGDYFQYVYCTLIPGNNASSELIAFTTLVSIRLFSIHCLSLTHVTHQGLSGLQKKLGKLRIQDFSLSILPVKAMRIGFSEKCIVEE
jgi:hypothetical protein